MREWDLEARVGRGEWYPDGWMDGWINEYRHYINTTRTSGGQLLTQTHIDHGEIDIVCTANIKLCADGNHALIFSEGMNETVYIAKSVIHVHAYPPSSRI